MTQFPRGVIHGQLPEVDLVLKLPRRERKPSIRTKGARIQERRHIQELGLMIDLRIEGVVGV